MVSACAKVIQLEEVLSSPAPPPTRVNYTDLDLSEASLNPNPVVPRPPAIQDPTTEYAVIDFEATSAIARAGRDHVRRREELERRDCGRNSLIRGAAASGPVVIGATQQPWLVVVDSTQQQWPGSELTALRDRLLLVPPRPLLPSLFHRKKGYVCW